MRQTSSLALGLEFCYHTLSQTFLSLRGSLDIGMISIIHYISASRRLTESEKTVYMLGGEREAPAMIRAQRDMIKLEKDYYENRVYNLMLFCIAASCFAGIIWILYKIKA